MIDPADRRLFVLSDEGWAALQEALDRAARALPGLAELLRERSVFVVKPTHVVVDDDPTNPHGGSNPDCTGTKCPDCGCCMHCRPPQGTCCVGGCSDRYCGCAS